MALIGVHEMHGRVHPNITIIAVYVHDPLLSSGYIYTHPVTSNLPMKTMVARQMQTDTVADLEGDLKEPWIPPFGWTKY